jgi:AcrR family transcriptional regulator
MKTPMLPRVDKRNLQSRRTRKQLLRAGRKVYMTRGLDMPTVEDVTDAAGVSRASFYLHFPSREAHILAVFEKEVSQQLQLYRSLTSDDVRDLRSIRAWVDRFIAGFEPNRRIMHLFWRALSIDPTLLAYGYHARMQMVAKVGRRVPSLRLYLPDGNPDLDRFFEMNGIFTELQTASLYSAFGALGDDADRVVANVVKRLAVFCGASVAASTQSVGRARLRALTSAS